MLFPNVSVSTKTGLENVENVMKWKKGFYMMTIKKNPTNIYIFFLSYSSSHVGEIRTHLTHIIALSLKNC